jgi:hypothetical protein
VVLVGELGREVERRKMDWCLCGYRGVKNNCGLVVPVEEPGGEVDRRKMLIQVWRCSRQAG